MADKTMKLYKVTLQGMIYGDNAYGISFVVAEDPQKAYEKVKAFLDEKDIGYEKYRELKTVELIAENYQYTKCGTLLYI